MQEKSLSEAEIVKLSMKEKAARRILRWGREAGQGTAALGLVAPSVGKGMRAQG